MVNRSETFRYLRNFGYVFTVLLHFGNGLYMLLATDMKNHDDPKVRTFEELKFRFLTNWNFLLQIIHASIALTLDYVTHQKDIKINKELLKTFDNIRSTIFTTMIFPSTFVVFSIFWPFFLYDRDLILPEYVDQFLSRTSNHIIHSIIVPITLWEVFFRQRTEPKSHRRNLTIITAYVLAYCSLFLYTYYERNHWIYPMFGYLYQQWWTFLPTLLITYILFIIYYHMQWKITNVLWGNSSTNIKKISESKSHRSR